MKELIGSEKQVAWANEIRVRKLAEIEASFAEVYARAAAAGTAEQEIEAGKARAKQLTKLACSQSKAAYWINRRDWLASEILAELQQVLNKR